MQVIILIPVIFGVLALLAGWLTGQIHITFWHILAASLGILWVLNVFSHREPYPEVGSFTNPEAMPDDTVLTKLDDHTYRLTGNGKKYILYNDRGRVAVKDMQTGQQIIANRDAWRFGQDPNIHLIKSIFRDMNQ